jgi:hypothetical protein
MSTTETLSSSNCLVTVTIEGNCHHPVYESDNSQLSPPQIFIGDTTCFSNNLMMTRGNCYYLAYKGDNSQLSPLHTFIGDNANYRDPFFFQLLGDSDNRGKLSPLCIYRWQFPTVTFCHRPTLLYTLHSNKRKRSVGSFVWCCRQGSQKGNMISMLSHILPQGWSSSGWMIDMWFI